MRLKINDLILEQSFSDEVFSYCRSGYVELPEWLLTLLNEIDTRVTAPTSIGPGRLAGFHRWPRHRRASYYSGDEAVDMARGPFLCVKGMEVAADDLSEWLRRLAQEGPNDTGFRLFEHFPLVERKAPLALLAKEAHKEAGIARDIHRKLQKLGEHCPRLPIPVSVHRHHDEYVRKYQGETRIISSPEVSDVIDNLVSDGFCVYTYIDPGSFIRVSDLHGNRISSGTDIYEYSANRNSIISEWIRVFSLLLTIGYMPSSRESRFTGCCLDQNNATIDGGFCDLGSCRQFSEFARTGDFFEALCISIEALTKTIQRFLLGERQSFRLGDFSGEVIRSEIKRRLKTHLAQYEQTVDGRLSQYICGQQEDLVDFFEKYLFPV